MYLANPCVALDLVAIWPWLPLLPCFLWEGMSSYHHHPYEQMGGNDSRGHGAVFSASSGRLGFPVPPKQLSLAPATYFPA